MSALIDINCDLGEGESPKDCQQDALIMPYISRCNIACGAHAGNLMTMQLSVQNAKRHRLAIGAHPSYPDKTHFGRKKMAISFESLANSIKQQIDQLESIANNHGSKLDHIKFHGALYNEIEDDAILCENISQLIKNNYPNLSVVCLANGNLQKLCRQNNIRTHQEAFVDRRYLASGKLSPRTMEGSLIESPQLAIKQAIQIASNCLVTTIDHQKIEIKADTLCIHGDHNNSLEVAERLSVALAQLNNKQ